MNAKGHAGGQQQSDHNPRHILSIDNFLPAFGEERVKKAIVRRNQPDMGLVVLSKIKRIDTTRERNMYHFYGKLPSKSREKTKCQMLAFFSKGQ